MSIVRSLYTSATWLFSPLIYGYLNGRARRGKEDPARLKERLGYPSRLRDEARSLVWIHAVSVGEANSAIPLADGLYQRCPHLQILMTTGTVTSSRLVEKRLPPGAIHQFVPVDTPQAVGRFINHWQPDLGVWIESEIWPNLIYTAHEHGVPLVMLNGRISGKSFKRWLKAHAFIASLLKNFSLSGVQTQQQKDFFKRLGATNAQVLPNLKLLAPPRETNMEIYNALRNAVGGRPVFFAASTHPGEEEFILQGAERLRQIFPDLLTIIAPRHMDRLGSLQDLLGRQNISYGLFSEGHPAPEHSVYLVDAMGVMERFYALASVTFVGATWAPKGGHNPIEAAQWGCHVVYGPHTFTNADLFDVVQGLGLGQGVDSLEDLVKVVASHLSTHEHALHEPHRLKALREEGMEEIMRSLAPFLPITKGIEGC